jgi:PAS domain S-box-containing protein
VHETAPGADGGVDLMLSKVGERTLVDGHITSDAMYHLLFEHSPDGVLLTAPDGRIRLANPVICRMLGRTEEELRALGLESVVVVDPSDVRVVAAIVEREHTGTFRGELRMVRADGSIFPAEVASTVFPSGEERWTAMIVRDLSEQREAEAKLAASEAHLRPVLEQVPAVLWTTDRELVFMSSSESGLATLGFLPRRAVGTTLFEYFGVDDPEYAPIAMHRRALAGESVSYSLEWAGRSLVSRVEPLRDGLGEIVGTIGTAVDITDRVRAEDAVRRSEAYYRSLIDHGWDLTLVADAEGVVRYASPSVARLLGYEAEEVVGQSAFGFVHPDDVHEVERAFETWRSAVGFGPSLQMRVRHRDGRWRNFETVGNNLLEDPVVGGLVVNARDVTDRWLAEETLREAEERYRTLVERVPAIVYTAEFGEAGGWPFVSPQVESILGYTVEEWMADPTLFDRRINPDDVKQYWQDEALAFKTGSLSSRYRMLRKDGQVAWIRDEARIFFDPAGKPVAMQGLMSDVTEHEELLRTRTQLVHILSHELFTPITSIQGAALMLLQMGDQLAEEDLRTLASGVESAAGRLQRLVLNLQASAQLDQQDATISTPPTRISDVIARMLAEFPAEPGEAKIRVSAPPEPAEVLVSANVELAGRALAIVVENALAFSVEGPVDVSVEALDDEVQLAVSDRGPGVPPGAEESVFEALTQVDSSDTRTHEGLGIGLFLARRIMRLHGGDVDFKPREGGGSTFTLHFPTRG